MDLLNTILNSMDKPPTIAATEQQKKLMKRQQEYEQKLKSRQKEELIRFRKYVQERMERFSKDDRQSIDFQPFDKIHRAIIHEVSEHGGFLCMSFGREDIDRYSVVYKKENAPTDDEIMARRNGDGWNDEIAKEYAEKRKQQQRELELENDQRRLARASNGSGLENSRNSKNNGNGNNNNNNNNNGDQNKKSETMKPTSNYKDKYAHLIGQDAALEAARKTETNISYGFVPSKNKKDMRSIEQTLADIQAKKRQKLAQQQQEQLEQQQQLQQQQEQLQEQEQLEHLQQEQQQQQIQTVPLTVIVNDGIQIPSTVQHQRNNNEMTNSINSNNVDIVVANNLKEQQNN